jgi:alanine racemase
MSTGWAGNEVRSGRATYAVVRLDSLAANVSLLAQRLAPADLWAVVKANAYGHGAVECARVAVDAGAKGLCVALTQEAIQLRNAGFDAPIMVLSEQPLGDIPTLVANDVTCVAYNEQYIHALAAESGRVGRRTRVHLKIDTGMHRVGARPTDAVSRARTIVGESALELDGVFTHLATADDPVHEATNRQLRVFDEVVSEVRRVVGNLRHVHVSNSAAVLRGLVPTATMARVGIAMYGLRPGPGVAEQTTDLVPVMSLRSAVSHVQRVAAGDAVSYGLRDSLAADTTIATVPVGYADGIPRRAWTTAARMLVRGKPRRIVGVVTMDQLMLDCGNDEVGVGDEVVIFGEQAGVRISVDDWADDLDTISYEVVCALSPRIPRIYEGGR